jgi:uncharacterized protein YcaQ
VPLKLADLRRYAVARSLFPATTLTLAVRKLGFVQADPIRAPARAQDLILRLRVHGYRAGDLERRYPALPIEEDFFVNHGFVTSEVWALMHPREVTPMWRGGRLRHAEDLLAFVRERGRVHPRDVEERFARGKVVNAWGGSSTFTTDLLVDMHYRGWLRVVGRDAGIRVYAARDRLSSADDVTSLDSATPEARIDALVDVVVQTYAPLSGLGLARLVRRLRHAVPQWQRELGRAIVRARDRLGHARVDGLDWYWPVGERPAFAEPPMQARLLAPFDPVVWDRDRFELFWRWAYRFEAYTPAAQRKLGYYALPLLWGDRVLGWANLSLFGGRLEPRFGYVAGRAPRDAAFRRGLDAELARMRAFLGVGDPNTARRPEAAGRDARSRSHQRSVGGRGREP